MMDRSELWSQWEHKLSQWKLRNFAATLIESSEVFHPIIAQFLLVSQPMFGQSARMQMDAIVELLEEPQVSRAFTDYLVKESVK